MDTHGHPTGMDADGTGAATLADGSHDAHDDHGHHPGPKFYILIGLILTIVTAVEIAVYYIEALDAWATAIIVPLSVAKFLLVVMFYMHLKYDNMLLTAVFAACGVLAIGVIVGLVILFKVLPYQALG